MRNLCAKLEPLKNKNEKLVISLHYFLFGIHILIFYCAVNSKAVVNVLPHQVLITKQSLWKEGITRITPLALYDECLSLTQLYQGSSPAASKSER